MASAAGALGAICADEWFDDSQLVATKASRKEKKRDALFSRFAALPETREKKRVAARLDRLARALHADAARFREKKAAVADVFDAPLVALDSRLRRARHEALTAERRAAPSSSRGRHRRR